MNFHLSFEFVKGAFPRRRTSILLAVLSAGCGSRNSERENEHEETRRGSHHPGRPGPGPDPRPGGRTGGAERDPPYVLSVFAPAPKGLSAPDSVVVLGSHVLVGYGDNHKPDGSDGKHSQVVEFGLDGKVVHIYSVLGHNDGLKVDPTTGKTQSYSFGPTPHGGGYDDIVFLGGKVYLSAYNPARNPNTGPAIVSVTLSGSKTTVAPLLSASATAIDLLTDKAVKLNLQDPDSMTVDPLGNIVLDSQADQELIIVTGVGQPDQRALRLPLSTMMAGSPAAVEVDDTAFVTSGHGCLLFADKGLNTVYMIKRTAFSPGTAFTAADGGPFVGALDMTTGLITPVVTGVQDPGGMVFVSTGD